MGGDVCSSRAALQQHGHVILKTCTHNQRQATLRQSLPTTNNNSPFNTIRQRANRRSRSHTIQNISCTLQCNHNRNQKCLPLCRRRLLSRRRNPRPHKRNPRTLFKIQQQNTRQSTTSTTPTKHKPRSNRHTKHNIITRKNSTNQCTHLPHLRPRQPSGRLRGTPSSQTSAQGRRSTTPTTNNPSLTRSPQPLYLRNPHPRIQQIQRHHIIPRVHHQPWNPRKLGRQPGALGASAV